MATEDRRARERAARRRLIVDTARQIAEAEGWDAVTTRRLSTEIEYSQPVLYKHFSGMDQVAAAVAIDGFGELARRLRTVPAEAETPDEALTRIARGYLDFARDNPAVYDAMFTGRTTLRFAEPDTPPELVTAFTELRQAVSAVANEADADMTLAAGVRQIQQDVEARYGVPVEAVTVGDCELDDSLNALIAAAREATVNAAKWSGASVISLFAEVEPGEVSIVVRDRGKGFDPETVPADRKGLAESVRGRMTRRGGTVTVTSAPGEGTKVTLKMPHTPSQPRPSTPSRT